APQEFPRRKSDLGTHRAVPVGGPLESLRLFRGGRLNPQRVLERRADGSGRCGLSRRTVERLQKESAAASSSTPEPAHHVVRRDLARFALVGLIVAAAAALYSWKIDRHLGEIRHHQEGLDFHDYYFAAKARAEDKVSIYNHAAMVGKSRRDIGIGWLPVY